MAGAIEHVPGVPATGPEWSLQSADFEQDPVQDPEPLNPQRINTPPLESSAQQQRKSSPVRIQDPDNLEYSSEYDPETGLVTVYRKIGNIPVKLPYT
ncbi:MAG: hypothetical protein LC643_04910, partial [Bacteroidales bacterium]|nr:hypothetical protein [Bacteroidales bacterium]